VPLIRDPTQDVGQPAPATYQGDRPRPVATNDEADAQRGSRFGLVLRSIRKRPSEANSPVDGGTARVPDPALPGSLAGVDAFRPELSTRPSPSRSIRATVRATAHHRLLIGGGGLSSGEVRIQIGGGRFAGSEIHLVSAGSHVHLQLLTGSEASRQTLIAAMDAVRERLRGRGLMLRLSEARGNAREANRRPNGHSTGPGERDRS
jgi:hypothetical protein